LGQARAKGGKRMTSDWYSDPLLDSDLDCSPCLHRHVVLVTTGTRRFVEGEVVDDIVEHLQCMDCLEYVSEAEVRAAWIGESPELLIGEGGDEDDGF
jgi:hypothetical protein